MRTSELTGHALNWAVAQAEGDKVYRPRLGRPSNWDKEAYLKDGSDDRWVVRVENPKVAHFVDWTYNPSGDWMQGGPIIEREGVLLRSIRKAGHAMDGQWLAIYDGGNTGSMVQWVQLREDWPRHYFIGPTPLIAAMRCYVASKLGEEVEIPTELTQGEAK